MRCRSGARSCGPRPGDIRHRFRGAGLRWWNAVAGEWEDQAKRVALHIFGFLALLAVLLQAVARSPGGTPRIGAQASTGCWRGRLGARSGRLRFAVDLSDPFICGLCTSRFLSIFPAIRLLLALVPPGSLAACTLWGGPGTGRGTAAASFRRRDLEQLLLLVNLLAGGLLVGWMWRTTRRAAPDGQARLADGGPRTARSR